MATATQRLQGSRIVLRELRESDKTARQELGHDPEIALMVANRVTMPRPLTHAEADAWYQSNLDRANPHYWVIEHDKRMIGTAYLYSLNQREQRARYAISLLDANILGLGLGTEATRLVLGHAFTHLGLHRVDLRVLAFNKRAIACYTRCGFVIEGRERETALIDNTWHDDLMMSILDREYHALQH